MRGPRSTCGHPRAPVGPGGVPRGVWRVRRGDRGGRVPEPARTRRDRPALADGGCWCGLRCSRATPRAAVGPRGAAASRRPVGRGPRCGLAARWRAGRVPDRRAARAAGRCRPRGPAILDRPRALCGRGRRRSGGAPGPRRRKCVDHPGPWGCCGGVDLARLVVARPGAPGQRWARPRAPMYRPARASVRLARGRQYGQTWPGFSG